MIVPLEPWQRLVDECEPHRWALTKGEGKFLAFLGAIKRIKPEEEVRLYRIARKLKKAQILE